MAKAAAERAAVEVNTQTAGAETAALPTRGEDVPARALRDGVQIERCKIALGVLELLPPLGAVRQTNLETPDPTIKLFVAARGVLLDALTAWGKEGETVRPAKPRGKS